MKAGFAERDITPRAGMEQPGGYQKAFHNGNIHDPCKVRAAVFDDGASRVALVGVDVAMLPRELVVQARSGISEQCGIPADAVLVGASHTHSGGPTVIVQPGEYDHASDVVQWLAYQESSCADPEYLEIVRKAIAEAVVQADGTRKDAQANVGSGCESQVAFNRRIRMKNGRTYTHPGKGNPDNVDFAGPTDPEVGVIGAWDLEGQLMGCLVNYACHGTTGPGGSSADWIYYMERVIRGALGDHAVVVFLNGACGDVTQVNNMNPRGVDQGEGISRCLGMRIGAEALKVLVTAPLGGLIPVATRSEMLQLPRRRPAAERVQRSLAIIQEGAVGTTDWLFAKEILMLDALLQREPVADVEIQAVQVGPVIFLSNPGELFCQLGLDIKSGSSFPLTFPVELANGSVGYIPTEEAFSVHGGGYYTRLTAYSNLPIDSGRRIVEASVEIAGSMKPGTAPQSSEARSWIGEWQYGNVPPELS